MKNFTRNLFGTCVCALLFAPASAQFLTRETQVKEMTKSAVASFNMASKSNAVKPSLRLVSVKKAAKESSLGTDYSKYGKEVVLCNEDMSSMKTGSVGNPDLEAEMTYNNPDNAWEIMVPGYMKNNGWGCINAYPAGGTICLYLNPDDNSAFARLNTCMFDCSNYGKNVLIQFDAYTAKEGETNTYLGVEAAETNHMGPEWDFLGNTVLPTITNEPKTYTVLFQGAGPSTLLNIFTTKVSDTMYGETYGNSVYLDNIKVYQLDQYVGYPLTLDVKYYMGTSFTLSWDKVDGAEKYLVDVYTKDENGKIKDYLIQDEEVSENKLEVKDAVNGTVYYYNVRGVKGNYVSLPSEEEEILGVQPPTLKPVTGETDGKYTAKWDAVPAAEAYNYEAFAVRKAEKDGAMAIADINFIGQKYNEGFLWKESETDSTQMYTEPRYTVDNPDPRGLTSDFTSLEFAPGWCAYQWALYKDALVLDGYHSYYNKNNVSLQCADMDLSKDNGKFSVDARLCAEPVSWQREDGSEYYEYARPAFALFNYDKETDEYVQTELTINKELKDKWNDVHVDFTKGSAKSIFGIFATYAPGAIYVQNMKLTQNYKAGEELLDPFFYSYRVFGVPADADKDKEVNNENYPERSIDVVIPAMAEGKDVYHRIQSVRIEKSAFQMTNATFAESYWSDNTLVGNNMHSGIEKATLNSKNFVSLTMLGNDLVVNNPKGLDIHVYTIDGTEVMNDKSGNSTLKMAAPQSGTYILKAGKQSIKFTL